jgi:hypothetical protein
MKPSFFDERTLQIHARISQYALMLTQLGLLAIILFRVYYIKQPDNANNDLRILLGLSVFGTLLTTLFYGGMVPLIKLKTVVAIYVGFVAFLFIVLTLWLGPPDLNDWQNNILPVVIGPALMLGVYWLFAWLGRRRIDKQIEVE